MNHLDNLILQILILKAMTIIQLQILIAIKIKQINIQNKIYIRNNIIKY
jgi:hypothetical protein